MKYCLYTVAGCLIFLAGCLLTSIHAQIVINIENSKNGEIVLSKDISIPRINDGYTLWLPEAAPAQGLIVFTHPRRDTIQPDNFINYALSQALAVVFITTDNRLEFLFEDQKIIEIQRHIASILMNHNIPESHLFYCGMSLEGTRALRLAMKSIPEVKIHPRAIAICDAPLDMTRFYKEMVKAKILNAHGAAANEGAWVSEYLRANLGGTPDEQPNHYVHFSPYTYSADGGPDLKNFVNISIRAYTEPDVHWWMKTRRKDYYGMNSIDLAAFINELNILGNKNAFLITTQDKGRLPDGTRHPHSWSIVDEVDLINWFLEFIE